MSNHNSLKKRIFICAVAAVMAVSSVTMSGCNLFQKEGSESSTSSQASTKSKDGSVDESAQPSEVKSKFEDNIAVKSQSYNITLPIMMYLFNYNYQSYLSYYGTYLSYYGFDSSKSLKDQYYDEDSGQTWYDYFMEMTKQYIQQTLIMAEAAKAAGVELDETDMETVNSSISSLESTASANSKTVDEYVAEYYGSGVTENDVKESLKLTTLAQKYYNQLYNGYTYTDEQYESYYNDNKTSYLYADFLTFNFSFGSDSSESSVNEEDKQKAKAYADDLAKCKTREEFEAYITKYLKDNPSLVQVSSDGESSESSVSQEAFDEALKTQVEAALTTKYSYEVTSEAGQWVFADGRKANETYVIEGTDAYTVIMMIKPSYRDETVNKNVRHILFTSDTYGSEEKAKAKADEIYKEWKEGEATEDSFAELAKKYSTDTGSSSNGGLYKNVTEGQMVTEFNDWVFDKSRKTGDTGIVKTSYGYHIMYFVGDSDKAWKVAVDSALRSQSYNEEYEKLKEKYTVEFDDDYLNTIAVFQSTESSEETETSAASSTTDKDESKSS